MKKAAALFVILFSMVAYATNAQQRFDAIGIVPFVNMTSDEQYHIVASTLTDQMYNEFKAYSRKCSKLKLDGTITADALKAICLQTKIDNFFYGTIENDGDDSQRYTVYRYFIGNRSAMELSETTGTSFNDVYDISDKLIETAVSSLKTLTGYGAISVVLDDDGIEYKIAMDNEKKILSHYEEKHIACGSHTFYVYLAKNKVKRLYLERKMTIYDNQNQEIILDKKRDPACKIDAELVPVNEEISEYLKVKKAKGLLINSSKNPDLQGISIPISEQRKKQDKIFTIITAIDKIAVESLDDYLDVMALYNANDTVVLEVLQNGKKAKLEYALDPNE